MKRRRELGEGKGKKKTIDPSDIVGCDEDRECVHVDHAGIDHVTDKAALLSIDGEKIWVPKSQIMDATEDSLTITLWFAEKQGWA
jgi:hypothetical protein